MVKTVFSIDRGDGSHRCKHVKTLQIVYLNYVQTISIILQQSIRKPYDKWNHGLIRDIDGCNAASTTAQVCTFRSTRPATHARLPGNTCTATREMAGWVRKSKMGWWGQTGVRPMLGLTCIITSEVAKPLH